MPRRVLAEQADPELAERAAYSWLRRVYGRLVPAVEPGEPLSRPAQRMEYLRAKLARLIKRGEGEGLPYAEIAAEARALIEAEDGYGYPLIIEQADRAAARGSAPPIPSGGWR